MNFVFPQARLPSDIYNVCYTCPFLFLPAMGWGRIILSPLLPKKKARFMSYFRFMI